MQKSVIFVKKSLKIVRDHCNYTGEYRGTVRNI